MTPKARSHDEHPFKDKDFEFLKDHFKDDEIIMFLKGGLYKIIDDKKVFITVPGDIGVNNIVKKVAKNMDSFSGDTMVLTLNRKSNEN